MAFSKILLAAAALVAVSAAATAAQASVEVFTDRVAFDAAISGSQTYGFNGLAPSDWYSVSPSVNVGPATFSSPGASLANIFAYSAGTSFDHYSTSSLTAQGIGGAKATLNVSISDPSTTAIGFDVGSYAMLNAASDIFINGVDVTNIVTPGAIGATEFIGFLSTDAISSVTFKNVAAPTIDLVDFTTGVKAVGGVPEPSEWALVIMGAGMAGTALRRRRRAQPSVA
jgi:hypothetical protein